MRTRCLLPFLLAACALGAYDYSADRLISVNIFTRHGDRQPCHFAPIDDNDWFYGWNKDGQLTSQGINQHHRLGEILREWLVDTHGLLSTSFDRNEVRARSSGVDRTIMSALSLLSGLYPPSSVDTAANGAEHQVAAVLALDAGSDPLIRPYKLCDACLQQQASIYDDDAYIAAREDNQALFDELNACLGVGAAPTLDDEDDFYDPITCDTKHFGAFPTQSCTPSGGWDAAYADLVDAHVLSQTLETPNNLTLMKGIMTPLFVDWVQNFNDAIGGDPHSKFQLYSGHDTGVIAILTALGLWADERYPPYASHVVSELWYSDEYGFFVNFTLNAAIEEVLAASAGTGDAAAQQVRDYESGFRALHSEIASCVEAAEALGMPAAYLGTAYAPNADMPGCPFAAWVAFLADVSQAGGGIPFAELTVDSNGLSDDTLGYFYSTCAEKPSAADPDSWVTPVFSVLLFVFVLAFVVLASAMLLRRFRRPSPRAHEEVFQVLDETDVI
eukprot:gnl/Chilomastix_cuspidata/1553.p1 GENE.gnl/Chilomastix_cuspidata/1553~~gnl/Chilomastix_cuspidata/1553.p1  ORF type:complete len:501 (+),score=187.44 gnl/Chilomastix_cuspidata/1553:35-1537(+)